MLSGAFFSIRIGHPGELDIRDQPKLSQPNLDIIVSIDLKQEMCQRIVTSSAHIPKSLPDARTLLERLTCPESPYVVSTEIWHTIPQAGERNPTHGPKESPETTLSRYWHSHKVENQYKTDSSVCIHSLLASACPFRMLSALS